MKSSEEMWTTVPLCSLAYLVHCLFERPPITTGVWLGAVVTLSTTHIPCSPDLTEPHELSEDSGDSDEENSDEEDNSVYVPQLCKDSSESSDMDFILY